MHVIAKTLTKAGQSLQSLCNVNNNVDNMGSSRALLLPHLKGSSKSTGSRGIVGSHDAPRQSGGDYTLKSLGIADSNVGRAVSVLLQMVLTHCALALAGLVINRPFAGV